VGTGAVKGSGGAAGTGSDVGANITVFGLMDKGGYFMHRSFDGSTDFQRVIEYFIEAAEELVRRGIKCVVLDNASMHNISWLSAVLYSHGIFLLYLPNYYSWWNPIELLWNATKARLPGAWIRGGDKHAKIRAATEEFRAGEQCLRWIRHCEVYAAFDE
jgi:transposase